MIVQDGCEACDMVKEILKDNIKDKKLILLDINSKKGAELTEKHKIETVPIIINVKDTFQQKCYLNGDASKMHCDDGTEKQLIKKKE